MYGGQAFLERYGERNFEEIRDLLKELHTDMGLTVDFDFGD